MSKPKTETANVNAQAAKYLIAALSSLKRITEKGSEESLSIIATWEARIVDAGPEAPEELKDKASRNLRFMRGKIEAYDEITKLLTHALASPGLKE